MNVEDFNNRIAGWFHRGEWTTYGDIAQALYDTRQRARVVGRLLAGKGPRAPVLLEGGLISRGWRGLDKSGTPDGTGPEQYQEWLEKRGIRFQDKQADPSQRVPVEELKLRDIGYKPPSR